MLSIYSIALSILALTAQPEIPNCKSLQKVLTEDINYNKRSEAFRSFIDAQSPCSTDEKIKTLKQIVWTSNAMRVHGTWEWLVRLSGAAEARALVETKLKAIESKFVIVDAEAIGFFLFYTNFESYNRGNELHPDIRVARKQAADRLLRAAHTNNLELRLAIAEVLAKQSRKDFVSGVVDLFPESDPKVRFLLSSAIKESSHWQKSPNESPLRLVLPAGVKMQMIEDLKAAISVTPPESYRAEVFAGAIMALDSIPVEAEAAILAFRTDESLRKAFSIHAAIPLLAKLDTPASWNQIEQEMRATVVDYDELQPYINALSGAENHVQAVLNLSPLLNEAEVFGPAYLALTRHEASSSVAVNCLNRRMEKMTIEMQSLETDVRLNAMRSIRSLQNLTRFGEKEDARLTELWRVNIDFLLNPAVELKIRLDVLATSPLYPDWELDYRNKQTLRNNFSEIIPAPYRMRLLQRLTAQIFSPGVNADSLAQWKQLVNSISTSSDSIRFRHFIETQCLPLANDPLVQQVLSVYFSRLASGEDANGFGGAGAFATPADLGAFTQNMVRALKSEGIQIRQFAETLLFFWLDGFAGVAIQNELDAQGLKDFKLELIERGDLDTNPWNYR